MTDIFPDRVNLIVLIFLLRGKNEIALAIQGANISLNPFYNPLDNPQIKTFTKPFELVGCW